MTSTPLANSLPKMKPAYPIPLSDEDLRYLGELAAIEGQIAFLMVHIAEFVEATPHVGTYVQDKKWQKSLGRSLGPLTENWVALIERVGATSEQILLAQAVNSAVQLLIQSRNDFFHGVYGTVDSSLGAGISVGEAPASARTVVYSSAHRRNRDMEELRRTRDAAAAITHQLADLLGLTMARWRETDRTPPWLLSKARPPEPQV